MDGLTLAVSDGQAFGRARPQRSGKALDEDAGDFAAADERIRETCRLRSARPASAVRRSIGYVPQLLSADGMLTGYENLRIFAQLYDLPRKERAARIDQAMTSVGLHDAAHHLGNTDRGHASAGSKSSPRCCTARVSCF